MQLFSTQRESLIHQSWRWVVLLPLLALTSVRADEPPGGSLADKYAKPPADAPKDPATPPGPAEPNPKMDFPDLDHILDNHPVMSASENREEYLAYNYFVMHARRFSPEVMAKHVRPELTFRRLFEEPHKYRGEIVRVEGRLKRLTWIGSNKQLEAEGINDLYEAWIFGEHYFSNPTCVIISELPSGVKPGEDIRELNAVADGYFFKRYKYRAVNDSRLAPLVIARSLKIVTPTAGKQDPGQAAFGRLFLPVVMSLLLGIVGFAFILHRWFRHSDRKVQEIIRNSRSPDFVAPQE